MNRAQLSFAIFGLLVVCALLAGSIGTVAVELMLRDDPDPEEFSATGDDDLIEDLRRDIEQNPEDAQRMAQLGEQLSYGGQLDEAITWYERALALEPANTGIRLSFALALKQGGKRADAELQFQRVIEAEPNNYEAHYYLADLYRLWDPPRIDEAVAHLSRVIEIAPTAYLAQLAGEQLTSLGYATPAAIGTVVASPVATPLPKESGGGE